MAAEERSPNPKIVLQLGPVEVNRQAMPLIVINTIPTPKVEN